MSQMVGSAYRVTSESFASCCLVDEFFETLRELVLNGQGDLPEPFTNANPARQRRILRTAIRTALLFFQGHAAAIRIIDSIGWAHSRTQLNVRPDSYRHWVTCLIEAVRRHDPCFSSEVETAWRRVALKSIDHIKVWYWQRKGCLLGASRGHDCDVDGGRSCRNRVR